MGRFRCLRHASRFLALQSGEVVLQRRAWIQPNTSCSSTGIYISNKFYDRFMLIPFVWSRSFHATDHRCSKHKDYYKILGVPKDASQDDIKKAFHSLAKKYHPDTNRGNTAAKRMFQEIRDAYEASKHYGTLQRGSNMTCYFLEGQGWSLMGPIMTHSRDPIIRDIILSQNSADRMMAISLVNSIKYFLRWFPVPANTFSSICHVCADPEYEVELNLSFSEAANGCIKQVSYHAKNVCDSCGGRGHLPNAKIYVCPSCKGLGRVTMYPFTSVCSSCRGIGKVIKDYCLTCQGSGVVGGMKHVTLDMPAGLDSGDTINVPEAGDSGGLGVQSGNLHIKIQVEIDPLFTRDGADIHVDKRISFTQAMLGGKVEVPTLNGKTEVKDCQIRQDIWGTNMSDSEFISPRKPTILFMEHLLLTYYSFSPYISNCWVVTERQRMLLEEFAVEEAAKEHNTFVAGNWWELVAENMTKQNVMVGIGILLLIHLMLSKAMN
ncbi:Chaperone protein dnaJ 1 mitochondrial [Zea mays]|uniref:Chaperone protein dnaJ 1 mitochondrial n=1 Tax=Zea mays TaxID=4577 RepID=A0A1D6NS04_MAIZE|nr:Chaperone protein dnaJ 1 mitochondrial [Zea mays]